MKTKNILITIAIYILFSGFASAQIDLILEAGGNYGQSKLLNKHDVELVFDHNNIMSYYVSAIPKVELLNKLTAFAELQYSVEGLNNQKKDDHPAIQESFDERFYYFRFIPGAELKLLGPFHAIAGLNFGYAFVQTIGDSDGWSVVNSNFNLRKRNDYGLLLGVNFKIKKINLAIKYNYGLNDINNLTYTDIDGNFLEGISVKNRFLLIGIGYKLSI